jgi:hypothetical protein
MDVLIDEKTKRRVVTADQAAARLKICPSNIRNWAMNGQITQIVESPRRVFYFLDEVEKIGREKAATRKKRGGRPRKSDTAA